MGRWMGSIMVYSWMCPQSLMCWQAGMFGGYLTMNVRYSRIDQAMDGFIAKCGVGRWSLRGFSEPSEEVGPLRPGLEGHSSVPLPWIPLCFLSEPFVLCEGPLLCHLSGDSQLWTETSTDWTRIPRPFGYGHQLLVLVRTDRASTSQLTQLAKNIIVNTKGPLKGICIFNTFVLRL